MTKVGELFSDAVLQLGSKGLNFTAIRVSPELEDELGSDDQRHVNHDRKEALDRNSVLYGVPSPENDNHIPTESPPPEYDEEGFEDTQFEEEYPINGHRRRRVLPLGRWHYRQHRRRGVHQRMRVYG